MIARVDITASFLDCQILMAAEKIQRRDWAVAITAAKKRGGDRVPRRTGGDRLGHVLPLACESEGNDRTVANEYHIERISRSFAIATQNTARQRFDPAAESCLIEILDLLAFEYRLPSGFLVTCSLVISSKPWNLG